MAIKEKEAYDKLISCGLKPSVQRMVILNYLLTHRTHPTIEDVHRDLSKKLPTLSKTTVYNTLRLFAEHKAALMVTIDERRVCYDGDTEPHAHFLCKECGKILDFFDDETLSAMDKKEIDGNRIDEMNIYYKGICAECLKKKNAEQ